MPGWLTAADVWRHAGTSTVATPAQQEAMAVAVAAVESYVEDRRPDLDWTGDVKPRYRLGGAILAYRLYERRTSAVGAVSVPELGMAGILREDPDAAMLLGIGRGSRFVFGGGGARWDPVTRTWSVP